MCLLIYVQHVHAGAHSNRKDIRSLEIRVIDDCKPLWILAIEPLGPLQE